MDNTIQTTLLLLAACALILLNGFFVATEFALVRVRSTRMKELADGGNGAAKYALTALLHLEAYLSATQLGITVTSLGLGWLGGPLIAKRLLQPFLASLGLHSARGALVLSVLLSFTILVYLHVVLSELAPRWIAIQRAERIALRTAPLMRVFFWLFQPLITLLNASARLALRLFGLQPVSDLELVHSEEELRMMITASGMDNGGTLRETQAELLDNVFDFGNRLARQIMNHRTEIHVLDINDSLEENVRLAQEDGHSRFPVIQGDIDTIIGFVHTKDLFSLYQHNNQGDLRDILREVLLVPETLRVDLLLRQMQKKRQHIAVLVDEYGGTAGLVTVADLLEELVGELPDEFEPTEEEWIIQLDAHTWSIDGRLSTDDLQELLERPLECEETCDTAGGFAYWAFGRIPVAGDVIQRSNLTLRVLAMDGRRVSRIQITLHDDEKDEG